MLSKKQKKSVECYDTISKMNRDQRHGLVELIIHLTMKCPCRNIYDFILMFIRRMYCMCSASLVIDGLILHIN